MKGMVEDMPAIADVRAAAPWRKIAATSEDNL